MGTVLRFSFQQKTDAETLESDLALAIFAAECIFGRPRVRMEAGYTVSGDGRGCVLQVGGESGEAAARIFTGLAAVRVGEEGFSVCRELQHVGKSIERR